MPSAPLARPAAPPAKSAPPVAKPTAPAAPAPRAEVGPGGLDPFPAAPAPAAKPDAKVEAKPEAKPGKPAPRIVGRYQANGVDYALFSDGSIEAERDGEKRRFGSLSELKSFIESA
jgi:hypothetical protein